MPGKDYGRISTEHKELQQSEPASKNKQMSVLPLLASAREQRLHLHTGLAADVQSALSFRSVDLKQQGAQKTRV